jgi:hypothetical protein
MALAKVGIAVRLIVRVRLCISNPLENCSMRFRAVVIGRWISRFSRYGGLLVQAGDAFASRIDSALSKTTERV